jgi:glycosyltransferase involved in cell wall biosynthesis
VIDSPKTIIRAGLRRARAAIWLLQDAWERRHEFGWRGLAIRAVRRLTGTRARNPDAVVKDLSAYGVPAPGAEFDVIYVIGFWPGTPKRYRVFNMVEGLGAAGYAVHVMDLDRLDDIRRYRWRATGLVLFRAEYDRLVGISEVLDYARGAGMRLVYDIDDLVFDPAFADSIDALHRMLPYERRRNLQAMERRRELLLACDLVTVSTAPLAKIAEHLGRPAAVIPNSINAEQMRVAAELAAAPPRRRAGVLVGYFSGSATHQRDFAECEAALLDIMERHPEIRLRLVGYLVLGPQWDHYRDRIEHIGFLAAADLLRCIGETDINLAPLELGNPFCEGKSELKFFEAALVGVPTVASATETFRDAVEDGVSGLLVRDTAEWRRALELLIASESRRKTMGEAARAAAEARFSLAAVVPRAIAALRLRQSPAAAQARTAVAGEAPAPEPQAKPASPVVAKLCSDHESVNRMG